MTTRWIIALCGALVLTAGCPTPKGEESTANPVTPAEPSTPETAPEPTRESLTSAECQAKGGTVVGDIGDGAIHRPDYRCESGQPPLGTIQAEAGEPVAVEGSVCCPAGGW
jgi:hypothetical protein